MSIINEDNDNLDVYYVSSAMTKKILYMGVEKIYLRFIFGFVVIGVFLLFLFDLFVPVTIFIVFVSAGFLLLLGQFATRKNPYAMQMALRHYSYFNFYFAQKKYGVTEKKYFSRERKGPRTFRDTDLNT